MGTPVDQYPSTNRTVNISHYYFYLPSSRKFITWIFIILLTAGLLWWVDTSMITGGLLYASNLFTFKTTSYQNQADSPFSSVTVVNTTAAECPLYFRWIYEDLNPWRSTGITREMIESEKEKYAHFRIVIVDGKLYVEQFRRAYQTRDVFTIWGFVQLVRLYPGKLPDVELIFGCEDRPLIEKRHYRDKSPPPLFIYSGHKDAYGVVFPDWSYWGWPEVNVRPWGSMLKRIKEGSSKTKWEDRLPYAYWKGNTAVSRSRRDLMKCNSTRRYHWNARLYQQLMKQARNNLKLIISQRLIFSKP